MPALSVLLKPASGSCGLRCRYCFYADESRCRSVENFGLMSEETLRQVVSKCLSYADTQCTFAFQGGEPTLRGLPFFRRLILLEKRYRRGKAAIHHAIQTNGMVLDEAWASFSAKPVFGGPVSGWSPGSSRRQSCGRLWSGHL